VTVSPRILISPSWLQHRYLITISPDVMCRKNIKSGKRKGRKCERKLKKGDK
jgi:hypothetical protein